MIAIYPLTSGAITICGGVALTVDSDLNGASPQFTLTCISTGGPATTVTWTRGNVTLTNGSETVLDDPVTAQYTHTLTVTGRLPGLYTCTVANNKPSDASAIITVKGFNHCTLRRRIKATACSVLSQNMTLYFASYRIRTSMGVVVV